MRKPQNRKLIFTSLTASVFLNVLLLIAGWWRAGNGRTTGFVNTQPAQSTNAVVRHLPAYSEQTQITTPTLPFDWRRIESSDYRTYVANLKAIGCPLETIEDIVAQDLRKHFTVRRWELLKRAAAQEFWKPDYEQSVTLHKDQIDELKGMDNELNWSFEQILGKSPIQKHFVQDIDTVDREIAASYGDLTPSQFQAIKEHINNFRAEINQLSPNDPRRAGIAINNQDAILGELGPEEVENYEIRSSQLSSQLRAALAQTSPLNEEEFRATYRSLRDSANSDSRVDADTIKRAIERVHPPR